MSEQRLLIVDSMALLFRGFFATAVTGQYMQTEAGHYTNGLFQFTKYLFNAIDRVKPTHIACAFDMGKITFRNDIYPAYKANRGEPPIELIPQFEMLKELVESFDIPVLGVKGYEADDVMGTVAKRAAAEGFDVYLLTGDGDTLQLVDDKITVVLMKKGMGNYEMITRKSLLELKGIQGPEKVIEIKSLMGDASDNIPGCPGIGPKIAGRLLDEYGDLEGIYEHIDELKGKMKERLIENKELVYLSRDLATIRIDVPIECDFESCTLRFDRLKIKEKFEELEFRGLLSLIS